jgi:hypothetical protein
MQPVAGAVRGRQRTQMLTMDNLGDEEVLVCLVRRTCA